MLGPKRVIKDPTMRGKIQIRTKEFRLKSKTSKEAI